MRPPRSLPGAETGHPKGCRLRKPGCPRPDFPKDAPATSLEQVLGFQRTPWLHPGRTSGPGAERILHPWCQDQSPNGRPIPTVTTRIPKDAPFPMSGTGSQGILQSRCQEQNPKGIPIPRSQAGNALTISSSFVQNSQRELCGLHHTG